MNSRPHQKQADVFGTLPPEFPQSLMSAIQRQIAEIGDKIVVLDDDPTGTQTVHDVTVLTSWEPRTLVQALEDPSPAVFVLTNTRSLTPENAAALNRDLVNNLQNASRQVDRGFVLISRSDSTLRGYFPLETDTITETLRVDFDAVLIIPAFMAGGRYTINSVHYVAEGDELVPAAETDFARDAAFGYQASNLREWVAEKTGGKVVATDVIAIALGEIRQGSEHIAETLLSLDSHRYCVVDAVTERDLEIVALAALKVEAQGKRFLYRTAASFAAIRAGIKLRPLLTSDELRTRRSGGGLVVVGSYVQKTSSQLDYLLSHTTIHHAEVNVGQLLNDAAQSNEIERVVTQARLFLEQEQTVVIYTSRQLITGNDAQSSLSIGNRVSASLVAITMQLRDAVRFIVAKGGITSSDIATKALQVRRAKVIGQIIPGVPVWQLDERSAAPHLTYVVFPGNVGRIEAIADVVQKLGG